MRVSKVVVAMRAGILLASFLTTPAVYSQTLFRCADPGGRIEYRDFPCGATDRPQSQHPAPSPQHRPSSVPAASSAALDASLRSLGFDGYAGYQRAKESCLALLSTHDLTGPGKDCPLGDMSCFGRAADAMSARYQRLVSTPGWRQNRCDVVVQLERGAGTGTYAIEMSHNDELFIINGEKFKAKTYCFGMERGDRVKFIEGSAFGACASARLLNIRTERICDVWCE